MKLEFHFDFGSPNAYLCHLLVPEVEARLNPVSYTHLPSPRD